MLQFIADTLTLIVGIAGGAGVLAIAAAVVLDAFGAWRS